MSNLVNLADYRKEREERELEELRAAIDRIMEEKGIEPQEETHYEIYDPTQTAGTYSYNGQPNCWATYNDCIAQLTWTSNILMSMGHFEEANKIDNLVVQMCNKPKDEV